LALPGLLGQKPPRELADLGALPDTSGFQRVDTAQTLQSVNDKIRETIGAGGNKAFIDATVTLDDGSKVNVSDFNTAGFLPQLRAPGSELVFNPETGQLINLRDFTSRAGNRIRGVATGGVRRSIYLVSVS
jgi:hypothetical protein